MIIIHFVNISTVGIKLELEKIPLQKICYVSSFGQSSILLVPMNICVD